MIMNANNKIQEIDKIIVNLEAIRKRINELKNTEQDAMYKALEMEYVSNDNEQYFRMQDSIDAFEYMMDEIRVIQSNLGMVKRS